MRSSRTFLVASSLAVVVVAFGACGGGGGNNGSGSSGGSSGSDSGLGGGEGGHSFGDDGPGGNPVPTCDAGCPNGTTCDFGVCLPPQPGCVTDADCEDDTYCQGSQCVPYGSPPSNTKNDPACSQVVPPGAFAPTVLCEFTAAPAGDPFPQHLDVQATPIVVNFDKVLEGAAAIPSIVAPFTATVVSSGGTGYTETLGIIRILKGSDCTLQANLGGVDLDGDGVVDWVNSPSAVAVADLNGDGVPEIVAYMGDRTTVAFTRTGTSTWKPLWPKVKATLADGVTPFVCLDDGTYGLMPGSGTSLDVWSSPSIHDLDNDGVPEIVREGYVIEGSTGILRAQPPADYASYDVGIPPVVADIYNDGKAALTTGAHIWEFDGTNNVWVEEKSYEGAAASPAGWASLADFNPYDGKMAPEIAVASSSNMSIFALDHTVFMGMTVAVPGGGGGPPTIADYDHDGLPEVGLAGQDYYTVFDPDCQGTPRTGGKCADRTHCDFAAGGACPDYILWSKKVQDHSSNITGSSVFDFPGAGTPEVVYADECFARVFSGFDGSVLFSQYHSSCTWIENPVVADVDGDFHSEIVVPSNLACSTTTATAGITCTGSLDANGVDADFVGAQCQANTDCISGSCVSGYCRCTTSSQCCTLADDAKCIEAGTQCAPPPAGTAGAGNTCRAPHPHGLQGIRVYKDAKNRWVQSRQIWSQHAYAVTHISETGVVPKTSAWASNWTTAGLNNFRQNVPGEGSGNPIGDLTAQAGPFFTCSSGEAVFQEPVCNRGTAPVGAGVPVGFYVNGTKVCSATTSTPLDVGQCENVSCMWASTPSSQSTEVNVSVVADDGETTAECDTTNDKGVVENVYCLPPQ
ncbi:MAG TPA: CARDB domain-containing protein [Polyangiaceae bacterium]